MIQYFNGKYILLCILFSVYIGLQVLYAQSLKPIVVKRSTSAIITKWTTRKLISFQKETIAAHQTLKNSEVNRTPIKNRMTRKKILSAKAANDDDTTGIDNNKHDDAQVNGFLKIVYMHKLISL